MNLHLFSDQEKTEFLYIAQLICLSDNPVLWAGKTAEELTGTDDLSKVAFQINETEEIILKNFLRECGNEDTWFSPPTTSNLPTRLSFLINRDHGEKSVEQALLKHIQHLPLNRQNAPEERARIATEVLNKRINSDTTALPSIPKMMLFELFLLCLADGVISNVEWLLLKEFSRLRGIEDYIFEDLLECAESTNKATVKAASVIFE